MNKTGFAVVLFFVGLLAFGGELFYCLQPEGDRAHFPDQTAELGRSHIVIDESFDGSAAKRWTKEELRKFKKKGAVLLCYFSIGEAENYRGYWQAGWMKTPPAFLLSENPDWKGNFRVRYWDPAWQQIILKELDRIVESEFDGVFLDIVDGFEYFEKEARRESAVNPDTGNTYRADMVKWVLQLSERARKKKPKFRIFIQNGEELLSDRALLQTIDGLVVEDLFSNGKALQPSVEIRARIKHIRLAQDARKTCFAVEYRPAGKKRQVKELAARFQLDLLVTDRELKTAGRVYPKGPVQH